VIDSEQWMDIKELHRQGMSQRKIAQRTGHSRNTIAKVLGQSTPEPFHKPEPRPSTLDPFKPYLQERYRLYRLSGVRLHEEIVAQGFSGSVDIVQRYLKTLKEQQVASARATVRFETAPGEQAQADWAQVGMVQNSKVYAFVLVLGFSRMCFVAFTHSMALPDLLRCHQQAFAYLGGVPAKILYDNMAQVRVPHSKELHPLMADFAAHYGFAVKTHRPYRPRTKGKVERSVRFVEDNFLKGRAFANFADLAAQGRQWLDKANQRVHATTGERPIDTLGREKLTPIGSFVPYVLAQRHERRVDAEGFVRVQHARYSVPPQFVGKRVIVAVGEQQVTVRLGETIIAEHRPVAPGQSAVDAQHIAAFWKLATQQPVSAGCVTPMNAALSPVAAPAVEVRPLAVYEELAA
jgi:transposase